MNLAPDLVVWDVKSTLAADRDLTSFSVDSDTGTIISIDLHRGSAFPNPGLAISSFSQSEVSAGRNWPLWSALTNVVDAQGRSGEELQQTMEEIARMAASAHSANFSIEVDGSPWPVLLIEEYSPTWIIVSTDSSAAFAVRGWQTSTALSVRRLSREAAIALLPPTTS